MRVLLDCRMATWTGVGRYTLGLARSLSALGEVELVCAVALGESAPVAGAEAIESGPSPLSPAGMLELGRIARHVAPAVTHCPHYPTPLPVRHPLVVTMHDLTPLLIEGVMPSTARRAVYRMLISRAVSAADAVITLSAFTATDVERHLPASRGKTRVTGAGADDFSAGPVAVLGGRLAEMTSRPYVLSMGSTRAHKDVPTLLRAFARIAQAHPELQLVLVGAEETGYVTANLDGACDDLLRRIHFTGRVEDSELRALYSGAEAFAFPSRYEGFGLPPLEAMALGAPVVCSTAASLPEVVGEAALTHAPGDDAALAAALTRVLDDPAERAGLIAAGRARASRQTWAAAAARTLDVYREVAGV